jgi:hypothetical protein
MPLLSRGYIKIKSSRLCSCQKSKVSFLCCLLVRKCTFLSKIKKIGMCMNCQTDTLPFLLCMFKNCFLDFSSFINHLIIYLQKVMLFFLSLSHIIKDISTDKKCSFKLLHTKLTDTLPSFYHLLSNINDLLEKQLSLFIYYTYDFE